MYIQSHDKLKRMNRTLKRVIILLLILIASISFAIYNQYTKTRNSNFEIDILNTTEVEYLDLLTHTSYDPKAYFFCSPQSEDCYYTYTEILMPLVKSANVERFENIYYVDITEIDENILPSALKNHLGFSQYPAFVLLWKENGKLQFKSVLEWSDESIFTNNSIRSWMIENNLWLEQYSN
jgi:hypothetical protein